MLMLVLEVHWELNLWIIRIGLVISDGTDLYFKSTFCERKSYHSFFSFGLMFYHSFREYVCLELQVWFCYLCSRLSIQYVDCVGWFHHTVPRLATFEKEMSNLATRKMDIFGSSLVCGKLCFLFKFFGLWQ